MKQIIRTGGVWLLACALLLFSACGGSREGAAEAQRDREAAEAQDPGAGDAPAQARTYGVDLAGYSIQLGATRLSELVEQGMEVSAPADGAEDVTVEPGGYNRAGTPFDVNGAAFLLETYNDGDAAATVMDCAIYTVVWYVDLAEPTAETFVHVEGYSFYYGMSGEQLDMIKEDMAPAGSYDAYDVYEQDGLYYYFQASDDGGLASLRVSVLSGDEAQGYR